MPFIEDFSVFLSDFAERVVIDPSSGKPKYEIDGIFDREYIESMGIESTVPTCLVETSRLRSAVDGDALSRPDKDTSFIIKNIEGDGTGMSVLRLREV